MCVLYVRFESKVRPSTFWCIAMGSAVLFNLRSILLIYSAGSGVNRLQVILSGFCVRLLLLSQQNIYVGMVVYIYSLHSVLWMVVSLQCKC